MTASSNIQVFQHFLPDHYLLDENQQLPYVQIPAIVEKLDEFFEASFTERPVCLCVPLRNTVVHTVLLIYLIERRVNFFLQSPYTSVQQPVPAFCDFVLTIKNDDAPAGSLHENLELAANEYFKQLDRDLVPDCGAMILSSSGTSGPAKFVFHRSEKLLVNARNCIGRFGMDADIKTLIPVPISHMYGLGAGLLPALLEGATIKLIDRNNVVKLLDALRNFSPGITLITPAVCKMLLRINLKMQRRDKFITAGESIGQDIFSEFVDRYGTLINLYGSTEMGAVATSVASSDPAFKGWNHCLPMSGIHIKLDNTLKNEILCSSTSGFEYYLDKNGARSIYPSNDDGWFRTKDRGEMTDNKSFRVLGRTDNCINRFGFVVSLREIELQLEHAFPSINEAVIVQRTGDRIAGDALLGICELKDGQSLNTVAALAGFKGMVPKHFVPDELRVIDTMPRLGNGKIDRVLLSQTILDSIHKSTF